MSKITPTRLAPSTRPSSSILRRSSNSSPVSWPKTLSKPPTRSKPKFEPVDSKTSTIDKTQRTEPSLHQTPLKVCSNLTTESLLHGNLTGEDCSLDMSGLNFLVNNQLKENLHGIKEDEIDDMNVLRRELRERSKVIESLKKENASLKREIEDFLAVADKIHKNLDKELRQYESKISALEQENSDLLAENKFYKEQNQKRFKQRSSIECLTPQDQNQPAAEPLQPVEKNIQENKKNIDNFYFKLNEQANFERLVTIMEASKEQIDESNKYSTAEISPVKDKVPLSSRQPKDDDKGYKKILQVKRELNRMSLTPMKNTRAPVLTSGRQTPTSASRVTGRDVKEATSPSRLHSFVSPTKRRPGGHSSTASVSMTTKL